MKCDRLNIHYFKLYSLSVGLSYLRSKAKPKISPYKEMNDAVWCNTWKLTTFILFKEQKMCNAKIINI